MLPKNQKPSIYCVMHRSGDALIQRDRQEQTISHKFELGHLFFECLVVDLS